VRKANRGVKAETCTRKHAGKDAMLAITTRGQRCQSRGKMVAPVKVDQVPEGESGVVFGIDHSYENDVIRRKLIMFATRMHS
jgi:hypothetical protein